MVIITNKNTSTGRPNRPDQVIGVTMATFTNTTQQANKTILSFSPTSRTCNPNHLPPAKQNATRTPRTAP